MRIIAIKKVFETIKNAPAFYYRREDIGKEAGVSLWIY